MVAFVLLCLCRDGLRLAGLGPTRLWPLLLLLPDPHLLHLWHIQAHLRWFGLVLSLINQAKKNGFKINSCLTTNIPVWSFLLPGTYAVMSVMIGSVTERLAPDSDFLIFDNLTNSSAVDLASRDAARVRVAAAVTCLSGLFQVPFPCGSRQSETFCSFSGLLTSFSQVLLGLLQLGFLVTYLSEPLVRGYTTGAAIHVIVSQFKYTFGINPKRHSGPLSLIYVRRDAAVAWCFAGRRLEIHTPVGSSSPARPCWRCVTSYRRQTSAPWWSASLLLSVWFWPRS